MKRLITLLSILTIGISTVSFGVSEISDTGKAKENAIETTQWEQLYEYSQYVNDLKN